MEQEQQFQLAMLEIGLLQKNVDRFERVGLLIQLTGLSVWSALTAFAYNNPSLPLLTIPFIAAIAFAATEVNYRRFQERFVFRLSEIEENLNSPDFESRYHYKTHSTVSKSSIGRELKYAFGLKQFRSPYVWMGIISAGNLYLSRT